MPPSVLDRAARLAARGRHAELVTLLEPQLPLYRDSRRFYVLLGTACLRTGDSSGAQTYLKRAEQLDPGDPTALLGLAALHLRRAETDRAAALYLAVLEREPTNALARKALRFMRAPDLAERVGALVDSGGFDRFYPGGAGPARYLLPAGLALALALALAFLWPRAVDLLRGVLADPAPRAGAASFALSDAERADPVASEGGSRYVLTEREALADFDAAKDLFQRGRDNAALPRLNRLLGSNAREAIRSKAAALKAYVSPPDWRSLRDAPSWAEVARDPFLHDACVVAWKGRAANIVGVPASGKEAGGRAGGWEFDFLAGYADKRRLDGIVRARFAAPGETVPAERPFELLARVAWDGASGFRLEVAAIHELEGSGE